MAQAFRRCGLNCPAGLRGVCQCWQHGRVGASMGAECADQVCARLDAAPSSCLIPDHTDCCPYFISCMLRLAWKGSQPPLYKMARVRFDLCASLRALGLQHVAGPFFLPSAEWCANGFSRYPACPDGCLLYHLPKTCMVALIGHA